MGYVTFAERTATDIGMAPSLRQVIRSCSPGRSLGGGSKDKERLIQAASSAPASAKEEPHVGTEPQGWRARGDWGSDRGDGAGGQGSAGPARIRGAPGRANLARRAVVPGPHQDGRESRAGRRAV